MGATNRGPRRLVAGAGCVAGWKAGVAGVGTLAGTVSLTFATFYAAGRSPMDVCKDSEWTKRYGCNPRTLPPISYTFNHLPERYIALPGCLLAGLLMSYFYLGFYRELGRELRGVSDIPARWEAILRWAHRAGHLASAGLVVTAAVSMKMHSMGHAVIAFLFFICGIAHIFLAFLLQQLLARRPGAPDRLFAPRSVLLKKVVLILFAILFVALVVCYSALPRGTVLQVVFPPAQWWTVATCFIANLSLAMDLRHVDLRGSAEQATNQA